MEGKDSRTVARICTIERLNWDQSWSEEFGWCTPEGRCWGVYVTKTRLQIAQRVIWQWLQVFIRKDKPMLWMLGEYCLKTMRVSLREEMRPSGEANATRDPDHRSNSSRGARKREAEMWKNKQWGMRWVEKTEQRGSHQTLCVPAMGGTTHWRTGCWYWYLESRATL